MRDKGPERLTLLTARGKAAHKVFQRGEDGKTEVIGYGRPFAFTQRVIDVDPDGAWLKALAHERESFCIMGQPHGWPEGERRRRLSSERDGEDPTIVSVPRAWMPIDIDKLWFEPISDITDGRGLALETLSEIGLRGAHAVWQLTNSHGIEGKVRLRLWVWLQRAHELDEMKTWAKAHIEEGRDLDLTVYRPAQPIYTCDPVFRGVRDPMRGHPRVGRIRGERISLGTRRSRDKKKKGREGEDDGSVLAHLKKEGWWIRRLKPGQHCVRCPWEEQHSGETRDDDTFYFEAHHNGHDADAFVCHHNSCSERRLLEFLGEVGYSEFDPVPEEERKGRDRQEELESGEAGDEVDRWVYVSRRQLFWDPRDGELVTPPAFDMMFARTTRRGKASERFLKNPNNTIVDTMEFAPGRERVYQDGALRVLNTYVDARVAGRKGDASPWLEHLEWLVPGEAEREWLCDWMSWHYQNPGRKVVTAPVLWGGQGNGKTTLFDTLGFCLGERYVSRPTTQQLDGAFNGWAFGKLLVIVEELMAEDAHAIVEKLKPIISNPTIDIRMMYRDAFKATNVCAVAACTNHMASIPLGDDDRRFALIETRSQSDQIKAREPKLRELHAWLESGGREIVASWLGSRSLKEFGPMRRAPQTRLKDVVQEATQTRLARAVDLAKAFDGEKVVSSQALSNFLSRNECDLSLQKLGAVAHARGWARAARWQQGGQRVTLWSPTGHVSAVERYEALERSERLAFLERLASVAPDIDPLLE